MERSFHITINGTQVPVTEEVYRAYMRPVWAERKRKERESRCLDERGRRCEGDCGKCDRQRSGGVFSFDSLVEGGLDVADQLDVAEIAADKMLLEELLTALAELDPESRRILSLFGDGRSEREIAATVGLSQKAINKRKVRLFDALRSRLKIFL